MSNLQLRTLTFVTGAIITLGVFTLTIMTVDNFSGCTGNAGKLREVMAYLGDSVPNMTNRKVDLPELQGEPLSISKEKCRLAAQEVGRLFNFVYFVG